MRFFLFNRRFSYPHLKLQVLDKLVLVLLAVPLLVVLVHLGVHLLLLFRPLQEPVLPLLQLELVVVQGLGLEKGGVDVRVELGVLHEQQSLLLRRELGQRVTACLIVRLYVRARKEDGM